MKEKTYYSMTDLRREVLVSGSRIRSLIEQGLVDPPSVVPPPRVAPPQTTKKYTEEGYKKAVKQLKQIVKQAEAIKSVEELAAAAGCTTVCVRNWITRGKVPAPTTQRPGSTVLGYSPKELEAALECIKQYKTEEK